MWNSGAFLPWPIPSALKSMGKVSSLAVRTRTCSHALAGSGLLHRVCSRRTPPGWASGTALVAVTAGFQLGCSLHPATSPLASTAGLPLLNCLCQLTECLWTPGSELTFGFLKSFSQPGWLHFRAVQVKILKTKCYKSEKPAAEGSFNLVIHW